VELDRFTARLRADVARLERSRGYLEPFTVEYALRQWRAFVHNPYRRLWDDDVEDPCGVWWCCGNPHEARELLGFVACALPRKSARELRRHLRELDERY
jgi:hypothetical protein